MIGKEYITKLQLIRLTDERIFLNLNQKANSSGDDWQRIYKKITTHTLNRRKNLVTNIKSNQSLTRESMIIQFPVPITTIMIINRQSIYSLYLLYQPIKQQDIQDKEQH